MSLLRLQNCMPMFYSQQRTSIYKTEILLFKLSTCHKNIVDFSNILSYAVHAVAYKEGGQWGNSGCRRVSKRVIPKWQWIWHIFSSIKENIHCTSSLAMTNTENNFVMGWEGQKLMAPRCQMTLVCHWAYAWGLKYMRCLIWNFSFDNTHSSQIRW